jgi:uncharacterized membrane protein YkoI
MQATPILVALALSALGAAAHTAHAQAGSAQHEARKDRADGVVLSIRQIESLVLPKMAGMQYLGPEYQPASKVYRLKFIDDGRVVVVHVDARTGRTLGHSR